MSGGKPLRRKSRSNPSWKPSCTGFRWGWPSSAWCCTFPPKCSYRC